MDYQFLVETHRFLHIAAGTVTLIAGPLAIYFNKNAALHRRFGNTFFFAMLYVCISAVFGYFRAPSIFFAFLLGIACLVLSCIVPAVRCIARMKGKPMKKTDPFLGIAALLCGVLMMAKGASGMFGSQIEAISILFAAFGFLTFTSGLGTHRAFSNSEKQHSLDWLLLHVRLMMVAFIASTTAFAVNAKFLQTLPWFILWFAPTVILVPLQIYFTSGIRKQRAAILARKNA
ncbi:MAG: hypothetical protein RL757_978 [Bacteroidota bacterium]|jgi:uncharacterized membrane protein